MEQHTLKGPDGKTYRIQAPTSQEAVAMLQRHFSSPKPDTFDNSYLAQGMSGVNEGIANTLGFPVDAVNWVYGKALDGVNAVAGTDYEESANPALGSEMIKGWMDSGGAISPVSQDPEKRFVRRVGQEIGAVAVPAAGTVAAGSRMAAKGAQMVAKPTSLSQSAKNAALAAAANPGRFAAMETAAATGGGVGAATAREIAPDSPTAELVGQLAGGILPTAMVNSAQRRATNAAAVKNVPDIDELRGMKNGAYQRVDDLGVRYSPQAINRMVDDIAAEATKNKVHPTRHKYASSMLDDLQKSRDKPLTLSEVDQMRQNIRRDVSNRGDDAETYFGDQMIRGIDTFVDDAARRGASNSDASAAAQAIQDARALNTRYRKAELIDDLVERATWRSGSNGSGGNTNNAIRQNLRRILENPRKHFGFTPEERRLIEQIVMGTKKQNALRQVGKLSPQGNGLMMALGFGGTAANPALATLPATGALAKHMADADTLGKVRELTATIRNGGPLKSMPSGYTPRQQSALGALLLAQMMGKRKEGEK